MIPAACLPVQSGGGVSVRIQLLVHDRHFLVQCKNLPVVNIAAYLLHGELLSKIGARRVVVPRRDDYLLSFPEICS